MYLTDIKEGNLITENPVDPSVAVGTGYSESKWVSETILQNVAAQSSIQVVIVRTGQLCGGPNGEWNINEWVPAMIQSSDELGCLPNDERVSRRRVHS